MFAVYNLLLCLGVCRNTAPGHTDNFSLSVAVDRSPSTCARSSRQFRYGHPSLNSNPNTETYSHLNLALP